jgi:esterase/lipase
MEIIYSSISSKKKKKQYIEKAYHTFISDIKNEHVFKDIFDFLEEN